jgi:tetratricopeptide (TPR) repeat protein
MPPPSTVDIAESFRHAVALHYDERISRAAGRGRDALPAGIAAAACNAHSNLGNALLIQRRPQEALASYDRALALNPDFGACTTFTLRLWPAGSLNCPKQPFDIEGSHRFVTFPATSAASGRNDKLPEWVSHPQEHQHLSRRTPEASARAARADASGFDGHCSALTFHSDLR